MSKFFWAGGTAPSPDPTPTGEDPTTVDTFGVSIRVPSALDPPDHISGYGPGLHQLPVSAMLIDGVPITPAMYVRDLGIYLDCDLSMRTHVQRTVSRCFAALRRSAALDSSLRSSCHIPDAGGRTHPLQTGLRQQCARWSPSLPYTEITVCSYRGSTAYLLSQTLRPHQ